MEYFINCNTSSLAPYTSPLDKAKVQHLYRRLGFSASVQTIDVAIGQTANNLVDSLIAEAQSMPPMAAPLGRTGTTAITPKMTTNAGS